MTEAEGWQQKGQELVRRYGSPEDILGMDRRLAELKQWPGRKPEAGIIKRLIERVLP